MDDGAPLNLTPREIEVLEAIREGSRSLPSIARRLDPPISHRTAEAHVSSIAEKLPTDHEPDSSPFLRVMLWVLVDRPGSPA